MDLKITTWPLALLLAACAALPPAQMALPEGLEAQVPLTVQGLGAAREGHFELAGDGGRFERSASRLALFDAAVQHERATVAHTMAGTAASCHGRQTSANAGVLSLPARPWELRCHFRGGLSGEFLVQGRRSASGREEREGRIEAGGVSLAVRSVHRMQGSALPSNTPIGYVFLQGGRAVGAVEINGGTPRIWRPAQGTPLHAVVTHAALALALFWDPATS
jgi:hypothetical protein